MKKLFLMLLFISTLISFSVVQEDRAMAQVNRVEGLYIFCDSKPLKNYKYLGSVEVPLTVTDYYNVKRKALIKKAKKDYPGANGLIITDDKAKKADVILID